MERLSHLLDLRKAHQRNVEALERQAAQYTAGTLPIHLSNELDAERSRLAAVEAQIAAPLAPDALEELTMGGQTALLLREIYLTRQLLVEKADRDKAEIMERLFWTTAGLLAIIAIVAIAGIVYALLDRFVTVGAGAW